MNDILYLAWRYLLYHRLKTGVLVASIAIIVYLPMGLNIVMNQSAKQLRSRATQTPLLVGAKGSPLELALRTLYFETDEPDSISYSEVQRVADSGLATAIPVYSRFQTRYGPIVATSLDYFEFRGLSLANGRQIAVLGECVIGSELARSANLNVGDHVLSSSDEVFNIAGVFPLKMKIVGVLERNDSSDDQAVFVDLKTAWVIQGLGHGHQDLSGPEASDRVLRRDGNRIVANASVLEYNEITPNNLDSFHFHGDIASFPITSVIAIPHDDKSSARLQGRYIGDVQDTQIIRPAEVMDELLKTIFTVGRYITFAVLMVGLATLATMTLVFVLSLQLRRRELETMIKIGTSRGRVVSVLGAEVIGVLLLGTLLAVMLAAATYGLAGSATRLLIQMT